MVGAGEDLVRLVLTPTPHRQVDYKRYKGKEGTRALESHYEKLQIKYVSQRVPLRHSHSQTVCVSAITSCQRHQTRSGTETDSFFASICVYHMSFCVRVCIYTYVHARTRVRACVKCTLVRVYVCACVRVCACVCMCVYV